jgi:hypothetical protein
MKDNSTRTGTESANGGEGPAARRYEAPTLILVGNARDLLAGRAGTVMDATPPPATQAGH